MYGDIITTYREEDTSESQVTRQAEEIELGEEQISISEESQAAEKTVPDTITPLPSTPIRYRTSRGPLPIQLVHEQVTTPIRATGPAEETPPPNPRRGDCEEGATMWPLSSKYLPPKTLIIMKLFRAGASLDTVVT